MNIKHKGFWKKVRKINYTPLGIFPTIVYQCSQCGYQVGSPCPHCPDCGADMVLEGDKE